MITKVNITESHDGTFDGEKGRVEYYWHTALVTAEGGIAPINSKLQFGSRKQFPNGEQELDIELKPNGKFKVPVESA